MDNNVTELHPKKEFEDNNIKLIFHCDLCLQELPAGTSPQDWQDISCGWTQQGLQVWCNRHECNMIHVDFEGVTHPASLKRKE